MVVISCHPATRIPRLAVGDHERCITTEIAARDSGVGVDSVLGVCGPSTFDVHGEPGVLRVTSAATPAPGAFRSLMPSVDGISRAKRLALLRAGRRSLDTR